MEAPFPAGRPVNPTAAAGHGLGPGRTVGVGDTTWDVRAARDAGLRCIALTCRDISWAEPEGAGGDEVYADPADLPAHLDDSLIGATARG